MPEHTDDLRLLSTSKAAELLGVTPKTLLKFVEPVRTDPDTGRHYFTPASIRDQLAKGDGGEAA